MSLTKRFKQELLRKTLHLPILLVPILATTHRGLALCSLGVLMLGYVGIFLLKTHLGVRVFLLSDVIDFCSRTTGFDKDPLLMAMGMAIALLLAPEQPSMLPAISLAVCDSAAALVGIRFGRHSIGTLAKTYEGSAAFLLTCFVAALFYLSPPLAGLMAIVLTLIELVSGRGYDNLSLPIATQLLLNMM